MAVVFFGPHTMPLTCSLCRVALLHGLEWGHLTYCPCAPEPRYGEQVSEVRRHAPAPECVPWHVSEVRHHAPVPACVPWPRSLAKLPHDQNEDCGFTTDDWW